MAIFPEIPNPFSAFYLRWDNNESKLKKKTQLFQQFVTVCDNLVVWEYNLSIGKNLGNEGMKKEKKKNWITLLIQCGARARVWAWTYVSSLREVSVKKSHLKQNLNTLTTRYLYLSVTLWSLVPAMCKKIQ